MDTRKIDTPKSSNVKSVEYDGNDLTVNFKAGHSYVYSAVPEHIFESFATVDSAGKWFIEKVKGHFKYRKIH